jgi:hypothetical protein
MTEAQEKRLIAYVKELAKQHNDLEQRVAKIQARLRDQNE